MYRVRRKKKRNVRKTEENLWRRMIRGRKNCEKEKERKKLRKLKRKGKGKINNRKTIIMNIHRKTRGKPYIAPIKY